MREVLYMEIPVPETALVRTWLQQVYQPGQGVKVTTPDGCRLSFPSDSSAGELSIFVWPLQQTTYLKVFRWSDQPVPNEAPLLQELTLGVRTRFPYTPPEPPVVNLSKQSIFEALAAEYPRTVHFFKKIPNGEAALTRVYWWEQRWREGVRNPRQPKQVVFSHAQSQTATAGKPNDVSNDPRYDVIYIGGALGVIHAAVMARLGYRVLLIERLPFGRMNREWNISRDEFQSLIDLGLFTPDEFETLIAREYQDGFHKFFDANNPPQAKAPVLHTPTVLNVGLDAELLLRLCGQKLRRLGGEIWDETEFIRADIDPNQVTVQVTHLPSHTNRQASGRLLVDAMGTASPIAWQLNGGRAFDSVCPTVGAVIADGFDPAVWDSDYGDVLHSHGDISRGRQLIWELFPGRDRELTIYLFHYHQISRENPGSLLAMYEDFFTILPEYRRCDLEQLVWKKATFGYIPGYFSVSRRDRRVAHDRLITIGDAASLQSPLIFTGFGSLVRNLTRLTHLLDTALRHNRLSAGSLNQIRAYQSNVAVTWLFSKGMMVPQGQNLRPERINAMLNTFFGVLASESPEIVDAFMKDRTSWPAFNRMALKAAWKNPALLLWIWELAGPKDLLRWTGNYLDFSLHALASSLFGRWFPRVVQWLRPWVEPRYPSVWFWLLARSYALTTGTGLPQVSVQMQPGGVPSELNLSNPESSSCSD